MEEYNKSEVELATIKLLQKERECSDDRYAIKLIEKIVFTLVSLLCLSVVGALLKLVIIK